jgi:hypothetical protein
MDEAGESYFMNQISNLTVVRQLFARQRIQLILLAS